MKKLFLILLTFAGTTFHCQTMTPIGNDPQSDCVCACDDAKAISYAFNTGQDSLWFNIETYSARGANYAYHIAIDKDGNTSNGDTWTGASAGPCMGIMNYNMMNDRVITVWPGLKFIESFTTGMGGSIVSYSVNVQFIDVNNTKIGVKLSAVNDFGGNIKLVAAVGQDNYRPFDMIPNSGFFNTAASGIKENAVSPAKCYYDPLLEKLVIEGNADGTVEVFDVTGKKILQGDCTSNKTSLHPICPPGIYLIKLNNRYGESRVSKLHW